MKTLSEELVAMARALKRETKLESHWLAELRFQGVDGDMWKIFGSPGGCRGRRVRAGQGREEDGSLRRPAQEHEHHQYHHHQKS